eukprot:CAMPEP_0172001096 /NCGR_PEP_ID=MMETSP1041-20130122/2682_1 /TAXON_ID=464988 /ORGANISM="Hemiselmis andersenii, Strain CCMP439" /LENGTH=211 /DNA_ID=CAMNT_0012654703 /DNA_START=11 /DNA_END=643 /DNA_ORIENTATION=-
MALLSRGGTNPATPPADLPALEERIAFRTEAAVRQAAASILSAVEASRQADAAAMQKRHQQELAEQKRQFEQLAASLSQKLEDKVTQVATTVVQREVQGAVVASLDQYFRSHAHTEVQKAAFTAVVAPAIEKSVKASGDKAVDKTVAGIKPVLQESFRAGFQGSIIPAFETACANMFGQINSTFDRGVSERLAAEERTERDREMLRGVAEA